MEVITNKLESFVIEYTVVPQEPIVIKALSYEHALQLISKRIDVPLGYVFKNIEIRKVK